MRACRDIKCPRDAQYECQEGAGVSGADGQRLGVMQSHSLVQLEWQVVSV